MSISSKGEAGQLGFSLRPPDPPYDAERRALVISSGGDWHRTAIVYLTDAERRTLIYALGGIAVEPASVHAAGQREAPAYTHAEAQ